MQRIVFLLFLSILPLFAESTPNWLKSPEKEFPTEKYIRAIGSGTTEKKAQTDALSTIALHFKANAKIINTAIQNLAIVAENDKTNFSKMQTLHQEIEISSDIDIYCVEFTDSFYDKKQKKYFIVSYIDKNAASKVLKGKIEPLLLQIKTLKNLAADEAEALYTVLNYQRAKLYGDIAKNYIDIAISINPNELEMYKNDLSLIESIDLFVLNQKNKLSFSCEYTNKHCAGLIPAIASILEQSGFVYTTKNALYKIRIDVVFSEEKYEAGDFVRPAVNITVFNKKDATIESYSKVHPRYGHSNMENAYNLALVRIEQDLDENFLIAYRGLE